MIATAQLGEEGGVLYVGLTSRTLLQKFEKGNRIDLSMMLDRTKCLKPKSSPAAPAIEGGGCGCFPKPKARFLERQNIAGVFQKIDKDKLGLTSVNSWAYRGRVSSTIPITQYALNYMWGRDGSGCDVAG